MGRILTYKQKLIRAMKDISKNDKVFFVGYNTRCGHQFNGTLTGIDKNKLIEMPVAENLIMGVAIGMAIHGFRPIVCIERMDFLWACSDSIINHLARSRDFKWPRLSLIIRTCVGHDEPLDPGPQHKMDYSQIFRQLLMPSVEVISLTKNADIEAIYAHVFWTQQPTMIIEYKKFYENS